MTQLNLVEERLDGMLDGRRGRRRGMGPSYIETNGGGKGGEMDGSSGGRRGGGGAGCSHAVEQEVRRHGC